MSVKRRESFAVILALVSLLGGAIYAALRGLQHDTVFSVATAWSVLAFWCISPSPFLHKSMGDIFKSAQAGELPRHSVVVHSLTLGSFALGLLGAAIWIKTGN